MKDQPDMKQIEQALPLKLPERLRRMRGYHLMHQSEVAALLHMDRSTYAYYETGASQPSLSTLMKLAMLYGVSTDFLLGMPQKKEQATRKTWFE